jgi:short-subunit dehydrogenase
MLASLAGSRIAITGASSGIGRELARELASQRARLVLNARREDRLNELATELRSKGAEVVIAAGDITEPATREAIIDQARTAFGGLDVLVNNAGMGAIGRFDEATPERLRRIMEVNFFALVELTRLALPLLKEGKRPLIVNMGSILGHRGIPLHAEYCASKFALRGFSEALRAELSTSGVGVLVVSPGTTDTEFQENVLEKPSQMPWSAPRGVAPADVARATVRAMLRRRHEIVPNRYGRLLVWLNRLSPRLVDWWMQRMV